MFKAPKHPRSGVNTSEMEKAVDKQLHLFQLNFSLLKMTHFICLNLLESEKVGY